MSSEWKKKALESEDPDVIKTGRKTAKRMFTMEVNTIKTESFEKDVGTLNPALVKEAYESIVSCFKTAKEIHTWYVQCRAEGSNADAE